MNSSLDPRNGGEVLEAFKVPASYERASALLDDFVTSKIHLNWLSFGARTSGCWCCACWLWEIVITDW